MTDSRDALDTQEHAIANHLIGAGVITEYGDILGLTEKLAFAIDDRLLAGLLW